MYFSELVSLVKDMQKQVDAVSARLATIEEAVDAESILADLDVTPEVAEANARLVAQELAELNALIEAEEAAGLS